MSRLIKFYKLKYTIITSRLHSRLFIILFFYFKVNYISHRLFFIKMFSFMINARINVANVMDIHFIKTVFFFCFTFTAFIIQFFILFVIWMFKKKPQKKSFILFSVLWCYSYVFDYFNAIPKSRQWIKVYKKI